jgi:WD40 repeat protein
MRDGSSQYLSQPIGRDFNSVAFSPDGRYVVAGNDDGHLRIWGVRTRQLLREWTGHKDWVRSVAFQPDGKGMASGGDDFTWKSWNLSSLQSSLPRHTVADGVEKEVFTCRGHTVCFFLVSSHRTF